MKRAVLFISAVLMSFLSMGQIDSGFDAGYDKCYTSLKEALANKDQVECLDLSKNKLKEFPMEVFECTNLKVLILNKNKINSIPPSISQLQKLEILSIYRNKIGDMNSLTNLPNLRVLDISDNFIENIPDQIKGMKSLEELYLGMNVIGYFSPSLGLLENLKYLDLTENEMNRAEQDQVRNFLPQTKISFSPPCFCNFDDEE